ncbi:DNA primase [candidate division TM6 bacterium RIFCSPHIGHO2_12_FULL_36_22]|nr:MAG: DNA primase [candidate division TM6 bacterium RIFCSPHIGHO2_12_FULL_36_22]
MNLFDFIKSNLPIADVIGEYVTLRATGTYLKGSCPFHSEKTGSFTVSPHRDIFYCFGCHESGDVIGFIAKLENCTQIEAAKLLTERYNLQPPEELLKEVQSAASIDKKKRYFLLCELVAQWCQESLKRSPQALEYLKNRGFDEETITRYSIGYFPGGHKGIKSLIAYIQSEHFLATDLIQANIFQEGKTLYSPFEERIIFPIQDNIGQFCGFGGRIFLPHDDRAKYYNSKESPFFIKGSILFGLDIAKRSIQKQNAVILVEGYTDCIALNQYGHKNSVATLGTACTPEHLAILARYADQIYMLYDGDAAGQKAIVRLTENCWNVNIELKVVSLPNREDPASFLVQGGSLKPLIDQASGIIDFFIQHSSENFAQKTLKQKLETVEKIIEIIRYIPDRLKRDMVLQETAQALNVPFDTLVKELASANTQQRSIKQVPYEQKIDVPYIWTIEDKLFSALILLFETVDIEKYSYAIELLNAPLKDILLLLIDKKKKNKQLKFTEFWSGLDKNDQQEVSKRVVRFNQDALKEDFEFIINKFGKKHWKNIIINAKQHIKEAQEANDSRRVKELLKNIQTLKIKFIDTDYSN